jgi:hypothetical protein
MARHLGIVTFTILILWGVVVCCTRVSELKRHREFCDAVKTELKSLTKKRPAHLSRKQWKNVVAWTLNAHGNCFESHVRIPPEEMAWFEAELKRRLQEPVDLDTIDWIWDEIVRLTPFGQQYSEQWRPTLPERLKEFEEGRMSLGIDAN